MTQNKFWLVWVYKSPEVPQQEFNSQEEALNGAKILAKNCVGKDVCVAEATHIIKGFVATQIMKLDTKEIGFSINIDGESDNVNGLPYPVDTETDLSAPTETPKPKFKIGDIVRHKQQGLCEVKKVKQVDCFGNYKIRYIISSGAFFWIYAEEHELTLAESETPTDFDKQCTPKEFKVGDRVSHDFYGKGIVIAVKNDCVTVDLEDQGILVLHENKLAHAYPPPSVNLGGDSVETNLKESRL